MQSAEKPPATNEFSEKEKRAEWHLNDLGLTFEDLREKAVLDVGAGAAEIAGAGKEKGISGIISMDLHPEIWQENGAKLPDVPYVKADASKMPFEDSSFDMIISHGGPINILDDKKTVRKVVREFVRVLKDGGEARFGVGSLSAKLLKMEDPSSFQGTPREKALILESRKKSLEFLKKIYPNIEICDIEGESGMGYHDATYFVLKKPAKTKK